MSRRGRALVTYGIGASKFSGGGGEEVYHSRVSASHGSFGARTPRLRVTITLTKKRRMPRPMIPDPMLDVRL